MKLKSLFISLSALMLFSCSSSYQESYVDKGDKALRENQFEQAEKYYRLGYEDGDQRGITGLGLIAHKKRDYDKAEYYYLQAKNRGNTYADYLLGLLYLNEYHNCQQGLNYMVNALNNGWREASQYLIKNYGVSHLNMTQKGSYYDTQNGIQYLQPEPNMLMAMSVQEFTGDSIELQLLKIREHNSRIMNDMLQRCLQRGKI